MKLCRNLSFYCLKVEAIMLYICHTRHVHFFAHDVAFPLGTQVFVQMQQCQSMNTGHPQHLYHLRWSFLLDKRLKRSIQKKASNILSVKNMHSNQFSFEELEKYICLEEGITGWLLKYTSFLAFGDLGLACIL